jgi:Uma2 family endonuclease
MTSTLNQLETDTWLITTWDEYAQAIETPAADKYRCYYHAGKMRIETMPIGADHSRVHALILFAISLFSTLNGIALTENDNCSYQRTGIEEFQPDLSYYSGDNAEVIPWGTRIVDLNLYPVPDLVIEIADTTLKDDQGEKRLLYEEVGVQEYWVVNVQTCEILAFAIANQGSRRIRTSQVVSGLAIEQLEEILKRGKTSGLTEARTWLLQQLRPE